MWKIQVTQIYTKYEKCVQMWKYEIKSTEKIKVTHYVVSKIEQLKKSAREI
jgi:hypothetical protein